MRDHEGRQSSFGATPNTGSPLVADFSAHTRGSTWVRGNGSGMIVGFHLAQNIQLTGLVLIAMLFACLMDFKKAAWPTFKHARIIGVGHQCSLGRTVVRITNHGKE